MKRFLCAVCLLGSVPTWALAASADPFATDLVMGNWEGEWSDAPTGGAGTCSAKVIARGRGMYTAHFEADVDGNTIPFEFDLKPTEEGKTVFEGKVDLGPEQGGEAKFAYTFADGKWNGTVENDQVQVTLELERVEKKSPTLGAKPEEGASVLLDGTNVDGFTRPNGKPNKWALIDGAMRATVGAGNIISKEKFLDHKLHVEFRTPFMPLMRGQARGNSGVYVGGNFEVQVLDSFGEPARDNEAGGIYKVSVPKENASLPPGEWQTYDITYYAPKTDSSGAVTEPGELTVVYNGVVIHDKIPVNGATPGGIGGNMGEPSPLLLQDHGNPVEFRNIWAKPLPPKKGV